MNELIDRLIDSAKKTAENAYVPYSNYVVGVALLTKEGKVFTGTNIENASFGATMCAERVALFKAVSSGYTSYKSMVVYHKGVTLPYPCGMCLQVFAEFVHSDMDIYVVSDTMRKKYSFDDLYPIRFSEEQLEE